MADHDNDAISLLTLCWSQAKANMPQEIVDSLENILKESGLPRIVTRNVPEGGLHFYFLFLFHLLIGHGYQLEIGGKIYSFLFFNVLLQRVI